MTKLFISILLLVTSLLMVFYFGAIIRNGSTENWAQELFLNNSEKGITALQEQEASLNATLSNARMLKTKIEELTKTEQGIPEADRTRLDKFIPDSLDNINLAIDTNTIAIRNGLIIKDVQFKTSNDDKAVSDIANDAASSVKIAETTMSFSVTGGYTAFSGFLEGLANSLRVTDVSSLSFKVDEKGLNQYNFEVKTYWVK
ncbi:MAG: type 4a pilus biogenesis protein PilO [Candidatus Vogelbacteria bacterium]|nr:type 4a pilus biogenesis protein PilO [Candidatus Vogelbacteria bacterium]